ncbi:unnamed protein product, partial [Closterium sp. NIES-54]
MIGSPESNLRNTQKVEVLLSKVEKNFKAGTTPAAVSGFMTPRSNADGGKETKLRRISVQQQTGHPLPRVVQRKKETRLFSSRIVVTFSVLEAFAAKGGRRQDLHPMSFRRHSNDLIHPMLPGGMGSHRAPPGGLDSALAAASAAAAAAAGPASPYQAPLRAPPGAPVPDPRHHPFAPPARAFPGSPANPASPAAATADAEAAAAAAAAAVAAAVFRPAGGAPSPPVSAGRAQLAAAKQQQAVQELLRQQQAQPQAQGRPQQAQKPSPFHQELEQQLNQLSHRNSPDQPRSPQHQPQQQAQQQRGGIDLGALRGRLAAAEERAIGSEKERRRSLDRLNASPSPSVSSRSDPGALLGGGGGDGKDREKEVQELKARLEAAEERASDASLDCKRLFQERNQLRQQL